MRRAAPPLTAVTRLPSTVVPAKSTTEAMMTNARTMMVTRTESRM